jgi:hypothetical protein
MARHDPNQFLVETAASTQGESHFQRELAFDRLAAHLQAFEPDAAAHRTRFHRAQAVVLMRGDSKSISSISE